MGFSFENFERNENLNLKDLISSKSRKTGTTICGIVFKDGVILGSDTRATSGFIIADKNTVKIERLADNIYCSGAGTSADNEKVRSMICSQLELHHLLTGKQVPVIAAVRMIKQHLFKYQGYIGCALILGGVDSSGAQIHSISPHGSTQKQFFDATGSGCLAAISVLEDRWKPDMELEEGKKLVRDAILAGTLNDLGSGNNIDLCIMTKDGTIFLRNYERVHSKKPKENNYRFKPKSTAIISRTVIPIKLENTTVRQMDVEPMEVL